MLPLLASLLRLIAHGLVVGLLALGQSGAQGILELVHRSACECEGCREESGACCSSPSKAQDGAAWTNASGGCSCNALPSDSSPIPACAAIPVRSGVRGQGELLRDDAPGLDSSLPWAPVAEGLLEPPAKALLRLDPLLGRTCRLLGRTGGERSALLGCARL